MKEEEKKRGRERRVMRNEGNKSVEKKWLGLMQVKRSEEERMKEKAERMQQMMRRRLQ